MSHLVPGIRRWALLAAITASGVLAACRDSTVPGNMAGTYLLRTVQGVDLRTRGPVDATTLGLVGYVTLQPTGHAELVVQSNGKTTTKADDTFRVRGSTLDLRLHEASGGDNLWTRSASLVDGVLTLRFRSPIDGPDIIQVYVRP